MALSDIIKGVIKTVAAGPVGTLRTTVTHKPVIGRGASGPVFGGDATYKAIVEYVSEASSMPDGSMQMSKAKITLLEPVSVTDRDRFVIPDGAGGLFTGNVQRIESLLDPAGYPYMTSVWLGT